MNPRNAIAAAVVLTIAAGFSSSPVQAGDPNAAEQASHEVGMRAYIDPETGELSPVPVTAEQMVEDELFQATRKSAPVEEIRRADGTVTVRLNGNFEVASSMVIGPDGKPVKLCSMAEHAGRAAHAHPTTVAQPEER